MFLFPSSNVHSMAPRACCACEQVTRSDCARMTNHDPTPGPAAKRLQSSSSVLASYPLSLSNLSRIVSCFCPSSATWLAVACCCWLPIGMKQRRRTGSKRDPPRLHTSYVLILSTVLFLLEIKPMDSSG